MSEGLIPCLILTHAIADLFSKPQIEPDVPAYQKAASSSLVNHGEPSEETAPGGSPSRLAGELQVTDKLLSRPESELPVKSDSESASCGKSDKSAAQRMAFPSPLSKPLSNRLSEPLTQAALAKRLGVDRSRVYWVQSQPNFSKWSGERDPDGIAWVYEAQTKRFYPQLTE